jgi:hypothetical protein
MSFTLYYVNATYHKQYQTSSGVIGCGLVTKTHESAREARDRLEQDTKISSVVITEKRFGAVQ